MNAIQKIGWALAKINWRLGDFVLWLGRSPIRLYHDDGLELRGIV